MMDGHLRGAHFRGMVKIEPHLFKTLAAVGVLASAIFPANTLRAANITWDTPTTISADTDVSTTGTPLYAYGFGNGLVPGATVNGVTFAPFAVPNLSSGPATVDSVTVSVNTEFYSDNSSPGSGVPPFSELSGDYQDLLGSGLSASVNFTTLTLTLGGLDFGQLYLVQFWSNDAGALFNRFGGTVYSAGNVVELDNSVPNHLGGVGQWVTGSFRANASTQVVTIESSTPGGDYPVINAVQMRMVPEPSAALLLLPGAALLLCRRNKNSPQNA